MENSQPSFRNPLRLLLNTTIFVLIFLLLLYIASRVAITYDSDFKRIELLRGIADDIRIIALTVFDFIRPFLQLIIILIIMEWLLNKFGFSLDRKSLNFEWNVQTVIALVVIIAFSLAALSGVQGAGALKDLALVVVGFYFGTQKRINEIVQGDTRTVITEEHINERGQKKPDSGS